MINPPKSRYWEKEALLIIIPGLYSGKLAHMVTPYKNTNFRTATYNSDSHSQMHIAIIWGAFKNNDAQHLSKTLKSGTDILI